jgi:hypothetical protein
VILEVPLVVTPEEAWRVLSALPPARGAAAGYEGTAVLEDADDDAMTATLRLQGAAGAATVAATAAVTVLEGRLAISAAFVHGPGGPALDEETAEATLGHLATTLAYALATANRTRQAWDAAVPPTPAPAGTWDAPSPPPARPARAPIPPGAVLTPSAPTAPLAETEDDDVTGHALTARREGAGGEASPESPPPHAPAAAAPPESSPAPPALPTPVSAPSQDARWVRRGAVAAAVVAAIAVVRGRR